MTPEFIEKNAVAALIGMTSGAAFMRQRDRLEADCDFPAPMPCSLRPLRWRRSAIEAWADGQGLSKSEAVLIDPRRFGPNVRLLDEARRA